MFSFIFVKIKVSALTAEDLPRITELNSMFNVLHRNFEYRILRALDEQVVNQKIFQAQGMSRLGFISDEINMKVAETMAAIEERASQLVNGTEAECIVNAIGGLENAMEYAGVSMSSAVDELFFYLNQLKETEFHPLFHTLLLESNTIQTITLFEISANNPTVDTDEIISKLEFDYEFLQTSFENAMENLAFEMELFSNGLNKINRNYFPELTSFKDYFMFQATLIQNDLPNCEDEA